MHFAVQNRDLAWSPPIAPAILPDDLKGNSMLLVKWLLDQKSQAASQARGEIMGEGTKGAHVELDLV